MNDETSKLREPALSRLVKTKSPRYSQAEGRRELLEQHREDRRAPQDRSSRPPAGLSVLRRRKSHRSEKPGASHARFPSTRNAAGRPVRSTPSTSLPSVSARASSNPPTLT